MSQDHQSAIVLQARMSSTRRPYKVSSLYKGLPLLEWQIKRLQQNKKVRKIIVATTTKDIDDVTEYIATNCGAHVFRGSTDDVMKRYLDASKEFNLRYIIRVCGDDPLVDPQCIEQLHDQILLGKSEVITASHNKGWTLGTSAEAFTVQALLASYDISNIEEKEHVVLNFYRNKEKFNLAFIQPEELYHEQSFTVDYQEDVENVHDIYNFFNSHVFSHKELVKNLKEENIKLSHSRTDKFLL